MIDEWVEEMQAESQCLFQLEVLESIQRARGIIWVSDPSSALTERKPNRRR